MPDKRKTTRREFLKGRAAADAIADLTHGAGDLDATSSEGFDLTLSEGAAAATAEIAPAPFVLRLGRRAMACEFEVIMNVRAKPEVAEAAVDALDLVEQLEEQLTVYRDHSEIMAINREAAHREVEVEPQLFALLEHAVELYGATGGAFDITAGPLAKAWGFYRRRGRMPGDQELVETMVRVGSQHLRLDAQRRTIRFDATGTEINLGGIGKGYALDRAAQLLVGRGAEDFLLHGGQSSVLARGDRGASASCGAEPRANQVRPSGDSEPAGKTEPDDTSLGWLIGVRHPLRPQRRLALVSLKDRAMGTSGSGTQFFTHHGKRYGHILDPRTGRPAEGILSVSVIAESAAAADGLATALFVMGVEQALEFCESHAEIAALIVAPGKQRGSVELHAAGLDNDDWQQLES